ncbi:hypothetical protein M9H77_16702 [Catharanthus roseus]|uniref:Uncharacterized protein n=1 Tax=Catharanthus roseus TaxID=4058 RepID=A0ACC0B2I2_CATRO|nr:hypothetical protein M9H77_16702 [Catharanthus roseus]
MSGSQSPNRADEAVSDSSHNGQSEPIREATPHPEQATHKVVENLMIKMIELLEASMATRRNERVPKFLPPEFYGKVEQEIKVELFLEQLNDIYNTLKYEDALRVTFAAFGLRGTAKELWFRASEARTLNNQPWTFQEEFKKEYIPRWVHEQREDEFQVELQRALAHLPPMGFAAVVEAATRTKMADQAVIQRKTTIGLAATHCKCSG